MKKKIYVTGDVAIDHFIIRGERDYFDSAKPDEHGTFHQRLDGGVALIRDLLRSFMDFTPGGRDIEQVRFGFEPGIFDSLPAKNNSYASVSDFGKKKEPLWRIDEFLGFGDYSDPFRYDEEMKPDPPEDFNLFILDDAGMDFGSHLNRCLWENLLRDFNKEKPGSGQKLVLFKKSGRIGKGELHPALLRLSEKGKIVLITLVSVNDIRREEVRISNGISWEQTAIDLTSEIRHSESLSMLLKSSYLIIPVGASGALYIKNWGKGKHEYKLIFDPDQLEMEEEDSRNGRIIGRMSCFAGALAAGLDLGESRKDYDLVDAIKAGLTAVRDFNSLGYQITDGRFDYPWEQVAKGLFGKEYKFSSAYAPAPPGDRELMEGDWSILLDNYLPVDPEKIPESVLHLARNIVLKGRQVLRNVPSANFGDLFTIDRKEIEGLRNLKRLIRHYVSVGDKKKPLNIGVFGPPGSGKSFAVQEVAKGAIEGEVKLLEFNLSQFNGPQDLIGALHQVRDVALRGEVPLVFFDEFDSRNFEWLQYLLSPMQDGTFQEGQITHPVGKCILVFAGGTSPQMEAFGPDEKDQEAYKDFRLKKGPDFISRLHGFLNILGPNQKQNPDKKSGKWVEDNTDISYPLRRACLIRKRLERDPTGILELDWGLMNALLTVKDYKHGSRSLASILNELKQNSGGRKIVRSHLPSHLVLKLCFGNSEDFLA
ncbi:ATP-binding protein, partial [bacterium]